MDERIGKLQPKALLSRQERSRAKVKFVCGVTIMFLKCFGHTNSSRRGYPTVIEELCHPFSIADLKKATNNFHQNRLIGRGYHGRPEYKGYLQRNHSSDYAVAVKLSGLEKWEQESKNEIELLCQLHHPNIISLAGFCIHKKHTIIVYEYMSNGSLRGHLQGGELSWKKRLEICIGAARGLHYLHAGVKRTIIHRDIHTRNILLDDNMHPKLADFRFSLLGAHVMSKPKPIPVESFNDTDTFAFPAPEYIRDSMVTDKCDVFSFGVVLLQVVLGSRIFKELDKPDRENTDLENHVEEQIDPNIKGKIAPECWQVFIDITRRCLNPEPDERPAMGEVEVELERALSLQEQADIANTDTDYTLFSTTIIP